MAFRPIVYAEPATGAVLYGFELPPEDGTTSWVDLCAACVGLPERLKRVVEGRPAIFSYVKRLAGYQGADRVILEGARPSYAAEVAAHVIHREALCAALAADHPLAQAADLGNEAFIFPQAAETSGFGSHLERLAGAGGFSIKIVHDVGDFLTALSMVAAGYGVVREPESMRGLGFASPRSYSGRWRTLPGRWSSPSRSAQPSPRRASALSSMQPSRSGGVESLTPPVGGISRTLPTGRAGSALTRLDLKPKLLWRKRRTSGSPV